MNQKLQLVLIAINIDFYHIKNKGQFMSNNLDNNLKFSLNGLFNRIDCTRYREEINLIYVCIYIYALFNTVCITLTIFYVCYSNFGFMR